MLLQYKNGKNDIGLKLLLLDRTVEDQVGLNGTVLVEIN